MDEFIDKTNWVPSFLSDWAWYHMNEQVYSLFSYKTLYSQDTFNILIGLSKQERKCGNIKLRCGDVVKS